MAYVLSNIELKDKKLSYIFNESFQTIVETNKKSLTALDSNIWCRIADAFQTAAIDAVNDYKLKDLAKQFNLSADLLA